MKTATTLAEAIEQMRQRGSCRFTVDGEAIQLHVEMVNEHPVLALDSLEWLLRMDGPADRLRAERDALLKALVARAKEGSGAGVLFIPDTLVFPGDDFDALEMIAAETGMVVVCGPPEAIEQVEERES